MGHHSLFTFLVHGGNPEGTDSTQGGKHLFTEKKHPIRTHLQGDRSCGQEYSLNMLDQNLSGVCLRISIATMKHHDRNNLERKGYIWLYISILQFILEGSQGRRKQGRNLESVADAEATEECCLLHCSACSLTGPGPSA